MASVAGSSSDAFFWVASRMKVLDRITTSSARIDFLRPTKKGRDHVRKYDGVAQRQHRIGSDFTWRKQWAWLCSGHGSKSFLLSLSAPTSPCAATTECRWPGRRNTGRRSDIRAQRAGMIPCLSSQKIHSSEKNLMIPDPLGRSRAL